MRTFLSRIFFALIALAPAGAQMVNPLIDVPGQPFSYPSAPTDVIGIRDALAGTEITPEGYLYTGFGEMMFLTGYPAVPAAQRIRTLEQGYLPVIHYEYKDGAVMFRVSAFSSALRSDASRQFPVNFIRVVARNTGSARRTSYFNVAFRYTGEVESGSGVGGHRFRRPVKPAKRGDYSQPGVEFDPNWEYAFQGDCATRSGDVVYMLPSSPNPVLWLTRAEMYTAPRRTRVLPDTPILMSQYALSIVPGKSETLVFKMPVQPIPSSDVPRLNALREASFEDYLRETAAWWEKELARGIQISVPERKVTDTFRANLVYDMIARDRIDDDYIQTVNKFHYHAFWLRDGAFIVRGYDVAGYHDLARQCLEFFFRFQRPDGNFVSQDGQYDGWGQAMWTFGQHYRMTRDRSFAERAYPAVQKAVAWLREARRQDPLHLMPASNPRDGEFTKVVAHISGYNLWALAGLKNAIGLATAMGRTDDAREFQQEYADYAQTLWRKLDEITANTNGYIPPGIDQPGGQDWGNMLTLYPEQLLPHFDRKVNGTLEGTRAKYGEGLMTYAGRLHHYLTMKNTETLTVRGEQRKALEELYGLLVHTSATHAGFEWGVRAWGDRDFGQNLMPHGWFGAKYVAAVRNMLLREEDQDLHLLSVVSPAWANANQAITVRNAPTYFGPMAFEAKFQEGAMTLDLQPKFEIAPRRVVVHVPWFVKVSSARADGKDVAVHDNRIELPATVRNLQVAFARQGDVAGVSYQAAVEAFKREYRARYEIFLRDGSPEPTPAVVQ
jgi:hypothetical protein